MDYIFLGTFLMLTTVSSDKSLFSFKAMGQVSTKIHVCLRIPALFLAETSLKLTFPHAALQV